MASRNGYKGWVAVFDVYDFHEGSSDVPVWAADGTGIYFTSRMGENVELMWAWLDGRTIQRTHSPEGAVNYHPKVSPDGQWLAFGSNRTGARRLYVMQADPCAPTGSAYPITRVPPGQAALWPFWRPYGHRNANAA